jgi:hypothetical protein
MYTNRPDLDAAVPEERRAEVYQAIYGWFEKYGHVMTNAGAELQGPETATTVKSGPNKRRCDQPRGRLSGDFVRARSPGSVSAPGSDCWLPCQRDIVLNA